MLFARLCGWSSLNTNLVPVTYMGQVVNNTVPPPRLCGLQPELTRFRCHLGLPMPSV